MDPTDGTPTLPDRDVAELTEWRRHLHRHPELSGQEVETAIRVVSILSPTQPDEILTGLGGHGVAAVYDSANAGTTLMLRCELDALPIQEISSRPYRSTVPGKAHLCGHDGHMAILATVARWLGRNRPRQGRVILMFQPAEEDGSGAAKVIADPRFATIRPDVALALHNYPGLARGTAMLAEGPMNCASRGMKIILTGRTAHASQPEHGISPANALAELIPRLTALGTGGDVSDPDFSLVTITHASMGEQAFGIAPGEAQIWATLRTRQDSGMDRLVTEASRAVAEAARENTLESSISWHDVFQHCENDPEATQILRNALLAEDIAIRADGLPMRASEDFGRFGGCARAAMFLLGAGQDVASLHNPDYDFPDALIAPAARVFIRCIAQVTG